MGSISVPTAAAVAAGASSSAAASAAAATAATAAAATTAAAGTAAAAAAAAGGSIFTLANAATAVGLLGSAGSAFEQHKAGVAQAKDSAMRSRQAGLEAGQKQINIRQNMLKALATQNAAAGAGGIGTGGSFGANVNRQITQNQNDLLALSANTSGEQAQYGAQGANALQAGNVKAGASLLDAASSLA